MIKKFLLKWILNPNSSTKNKIRTIRRNKQFYEIINNEVVKSFEESLKIDYFL